MTEHLSRKATNSEDPNPTPLPAKQRPLVSPKSAGLSAIQYLAGHVSHIKTDHPLSFQKVLSECEGNWDEIALLLYVLWLNQEFLFLMLF